MDTNQHCESCGEETVTIKFQGSQYCQECVDDRTYDMDEEDMIPEHIAYEREQGEIFNDRYQAWRNEY